MSFHRVMTKPLQWGKPYDVRALMPEIRGSQVPEKIVDEVREVWHRADYEIVTGRKPPQKPDAVERMRLEREEKALWRMMGHEI